MTSNDINSTDASASPGTTDERLWRIRTENGDTFGPADLATLKKWALDGRLAPTHQFSDDGQTWLAVTSLAELEMDWVAEVTPGSFYGPIHMLALAELVREGSISPTAPRFYRGMQHALPPADPAPQLEPHVRELPQQLAGRSTELEAQLTAIRSELEQARNALGARDFEMDAERQEHKAALARLQAELFKREGRITALEADTVRIRQEMETRLFEAERHAAGQARQIAQQQEALALATQLQQEAERHATLQKEHVAKHDRDTAALRDSVRNMKLHLESARKMLQQAGNALIEEDGATDAEIVAEPPAPPPGTDRMGPPPLATPNGRAKTAMSLADLEAQVQRELRQLGHKGVNLLKRSKG